MSAMTMTGEARRVGLRKVLLADGVVSGGAGLLLLLAAGPLSDAFGLSVTFLRVVGVSLLPWCALLANVATRRVISRAAVTGIIGVNLAWVAGSVVLLFSGWVDPTGLGTAFVVAQAIAVLTFAELQILGLRRG